MIVFLVGFVILLVIGVPISISIGASAVLGCLSLGYPMVVIGQKMVSGIDSFLLIAIPLFIFAGNLMNAGSITKKIFNTARELVGWIPGGLGHANKYDIDQRSFEDEVFPFRKGETRRIQMDRTVVIITVDGLSLFCLECPVTHAAAIHADGLDGIGAEKRHRSAFLCQQSYCIALAYKIIAYIPHSRQVAGSNWWVGDDEDMRMFICH